MNNEGLKGQIQDELQNYLTGVVNISEDYNYSQAKLVRRIALFENHIYPKGKFTAAGDYKFWFDIATPRVNAEIKNIDFDTKDITAYSERKVDELPCIICNLKLKEFLRETGQAEEINNAIEEGSAWGNVVWKKIKGGYERVDLKNFYVINQTAQFLTESPVIERHQLSQSDIRGMAGAWKNVEEVLKDCKTNSYSSTTESISNETTTPYYEVFERNGEVKLSDLKEYKGLEVTDKDKNTYVLAKVVAAGVKGSGSSLDIKHIMFAEQIGKMPYKEYHRGRYKGRWFREGIIELLFDIQVRCNQIGNQMAQGLEWASKTIFISDDKLVAQNILTDLKNGDIIKARSLQQVATRMEGFDQLANEWNRLLQLADQITNASEIIQGESLPSGTPFRLGALQNLNANKLYDFIREKIAIPFSEIFEEWIVPEQVKDLKAKEILRLTGDSDKLERLIVTIVDNWYITNLIEIGPHTKEMADALKKEKLDELKSRPQLLMQNLETMWENFKPNVSIVITGEQSTLTQDLETIKGFIQLEADPTRRQAMIEMAMRKKGIDVGSLPKTPPMPQQTQPTNNNRGMVPAQTNENNAPVQA